MTAASPYRSKEEYGEGLQARLDALAFLLKNGARHVPDNKGRGALHAACGGSILPQKEIGLLVRAGFDINLRDAEGRTPLMLWLAEASGGLSNHEERILRAVPDDAKFLLSLKADPAVTDKRGRNAAAFMSGQLRGNLERDSPGTLALLTSPPRKTDVLLNLCATGCDEAAIRGAVAGGMDIDPRDEAGDTPLHLAARRGDEATVRALIANGAPLEVFNDNHENALGAALRHEQWAVFRVLLEAGADINAQGSLVLWDNGTRSIKLTPLAASIYSGNPDQQKYILALKQNLEAKTFIYVDDDSEGTAVHAAALVNNAAVLEALLTLGANPDAGLSRMGTTPLHLAAANDSAECVDILLRHGARADAVTTQGKTPADVARDPALKKLLRDAARKPR